MITVFIIPIIIIILICIFAFISTEDGLFLVPVILLVLWPVIALFGHETPVKITEEKIVIKDASAYIVGSNINFNEYFKKQFSEGDIIYQVKVIPYWHRGMYWFNHPDSQIFVLDKKDLIGYKIVNEKTN